MTSSRPYLVRAIHEWILDNDLTPHIVANADAEGVHVPLDYVKDGQISLNISAAAVHGLSIDNDWIVFDARFGGKSLQVSVPTGAVVAIFAKENGAGMSFGEDEQLDNPPPEPGGKRKKKVEKKPEKSSKSQPTLRIVK
ncbi:MAG: ClpXP protease specificity-enhancing factor [Lysobacterales bacterium]|nr:MAG: ClpXP protease specificity-enhancing factor [Xanthomonadales bacterium]